MKKRVLLFALPLLLIASCGKSQESHVHQYVIEDATPDYLKSEATCTEAAVYYLHCTCGATDESHVFSDGDPLGHDFVLNEDGTLYTCSRCGATEDGPNAGHGDYGTDYYDGYYSSVLDWENGEDLKNKLYTLLHDGYTALEYDDPNWESNQYADQAQDDFEKVNVVYSSADDLKSETYNGRSGWQREHAFAASLMTGFTSGEAVTGPGRATDFHNLFASYGSGNTSRGNKNFGVADSSDYGYQSVGSDADHRGDYACDTYNFEPSEEDKGMLARAIFYMGVMYSDTETNTVKVSKTSTTKTTISVTYKPLSIVEDYVNYSKIPYTSYISDSPTEEVVALRQTYGTGEAGYAAYSLDNCSFAIGNLSTLLSWNSLSVSREEYQHNESVYSHVYSGQSVAQGNRNPFTDYPDLVDYVYGEKKDQAGQLRYLKPSCLALNVTGDKSGETSHYAVSSGTREFEVGETFDSSSLEIVRVKNDFTYETVTDVDVPTYVFTDQDADIGSHTFTIATPMNTLTYKVTVNSDDISKCCYSHDLKSEDVSKHVYTTAHSHTLSGVTWNVTAGTETSVTNSTALGAKFGGATSSTPPVGTLTFETAESFTYDNKSGVTSVYVKADTASGVTYTMKVKVGSFTSTAITIRYNKEDSEVYGIDLSAPTEGKVTIEFTDVTKALYVKTIAVNAVSI